MGAAKLPLCILAYIYFFLAESVHMKMSTLKTSASPFGRTVFCSRLAAPVLKEYACSEAIISVADHMQILYRFIPPSPMSPYATSTLRPSFIAERNPT